MIPNSLSVHAVPTLGCEPACTPGDLGGLLALLDGRETAMPLVSVRVRTRITGVVARTTVEQRFRNTLTSPMEAVHIFPVPSAGAVVACELRCGELTVRATCMEREAAEATFAEARQRGKRAALLTQERADIHTLRVTNLPPKEEITVRTEIVERLDSEDGRVLWRFPTVIAPRYLPGNPIQTGSGPGVLPDTDRVPDASRLSPPLLLEGGARLDLEVALDGAPGRLESSLHALAVALEGGVRVAPAGDARCDRDFVLALTWADPTAVKTRAWTDGGYTLVHIEAPLAPSRVLPRDVVFVVDISGSMAGSKIVAARRALTAALHGLIAGDRFHLVAFDDRLELYAPDFVAYDAASLARADRWIAALQPRGGTEMLPAIREALKGTTPAGRLRTVLFVTDGQASNEQELVAAVANRRAGPASGPGAGEARFFTLGIDTAVNEALLSRLARVGGGTATFATPSDDIEAVVARMEGRFGSPVAIDVRVSGGEAARPEPEALFAGLGVGVLLKGAPAQVAVSLRTSSGNETVLLENARLDGTGDLFRALWARERVAMLEDRLVLKPFEEEALRPEIVKTALFASEGAPKGAGIASRFTAFVAVEEMVTVGGERVTVVQGHPLPAQWEEQGNMMRGGPPAGAPMPSPMMSAMPRTSPAPAGGSRARSTAAPAKSAGVMGKVRGLFAPAPPPAARSVEDDADADTAFFAIDAARPMLVSESAPQFDRSVAGPKGKSTAPTPDAILAATQGADGSFGGDVARTAAALLTLILLGNTRTRGLRKRNVQKAAAWLQNRTEADAVRVLAALDAAEAGGPHPAAWATLLGAGPEGKLLSSVQAGLTTALS